MEQLSETEIGALAEALDDEYQAFATYGQVIDDFGPVRPFVNIREAEGRHIAALQRLFERYGVAPRRGRRELGDPLTEIENRCEEAEPVVAHRGRLRDRRVDVAEILHPETELLREVLSQSGVADRRRAHVDSAATGAEVERRSDHCDLARSRLHGHGRKG